MKRKRYTHEQIISILKEHEAGQPAGELSRRYGVVENTIYFREYCLDLHWFGSLAEARAIIERWRMHYNHVRPHRSVGNMPPSVFARKVA